MPKKGALVIGLDIGGSKTLAGLVARDGEIRRTLQVATAPSSAAILSSARALCEALIGASEAPVLGIGIGSAGVIDTDAGSVIFANENMPGWTGTRLTAFDFGAELPITVENDVRALAYGEAVMGAGADYDSLLCLTVGTGIGGALIINGELWHGADYSAGEIGYLVVDWDGDAPLILDQYASGPAIERAYQAATGGENRLPLTEISRLAKAGDRTAIEVIEVKARRLGIILAGAATALNPAAVVVGGGVPQIGALWWEALAAAFRENLPPPVAATPLKPATLGANGVMLGAAMLAWKALDA
ncbi:MAG: ROK family protein [Chloroflexota bacterium]|nr:ROK family protein [Chloroflexota bacterium]